MPKQPPETRKGAPQSVSWKLRGTTLSLDQPVLMGVVNATPDSFSDGGAFDTADQAVAAGHTMANEGAAIIDVGGESTRPGAEPVNVDEELGRVLPIIEGLLRGGLLVSVDTSKPTVARRAIEAGAVIVNDVTGLRDPEMRAVCAETGVGVVIMHAKGTPTTMQDSPHYVDVVSEVAVFLADAATSAMAAGVERSAIVVDPGIGFGKSYDHNLALLSAMDAIVDIGFPVLLGTSRKGFLGTILEPSRGSTAPKDRDGATAATIALAVAEGVKILRVHNVALAADVARVVWAIVQISHGKEENRT